MKDSFVSVRILDLPYTLDREFTYLLPAALRPNVRPGTLLVVPFGRGDKKKTAVAVSFADACGLQRVKKVEKILDYAVTIPEEFVPLATFMMERFFCTFGQAFRTILPPGINVRTETYYVPSDVVFLAGMEESPSVDGRSALLHRLRTDGELTEKQLADDFGEDGAALMQALICEGLAEKHTRVPQVINEKTVTMLSLSVSAEKASALLGGEETVTPPLTEKQKVLIELLMHYPCATLQDVAAIGGISPAVVSSAVRKGLVSKTETRVDRSRKPVEKSAETADSAEEDGMPSPPLNEEQTHALSVLSGMIRERKTGAALLFGVTGSGKTRVIIEAVRETLAGGRSAIVLLPEIGLTAQAMSVYRKAFGRELAVIHSMLSIGERLDAYRAIQEGTVRVVLGTRSAVFSPVRDLGLIVIDEEQESTFKSDSSPRYHARDIARFRCIKNDAVLLLSSATPSIESYSKAVSENGPYVLLKLTKRAGDAKLPQVKIDDLRNDGTVFPDRLIGQALKERLDDVLAAKRQAILFVNRRGFQSHVSCHSCGYVFRCENCSVSLTYHAYTGIRRSAGRLVCHYCGYSDPLPRTCPKCGSEHIGFSGFGTQKLQEELEERFPDARIARMDMDTTTQKNSHGKILAAFGNGETDILFGTQMVTKGLNFPSVDLVGVVSVDTLLYQPDFRAGERTFSLITQLVGRAGRAGQDGVAVLQTYNPDNEILGLAARQDYEAFYRSEIRLRKSVHFPPFGSLLALTVTSQSEEDCADYAKKISERFEEMCPPPDPKKMSEEDPCIFKFGPYPSGMYRIGTYFRHVILFKYKDRRTERELFASFLREAWEHCPDNVRLEPDANPMNV